MIEKWYCIRCDSCGEVINYWQEPNKYAALNREREMDVEGKDNKTIIKGSKTFCNSECFANYYKEK